MKVLLSGAFGFLGKFIYNELVTHNEVVTLSRTQGDIKVDLIREIPKLPDVKLVVHCAGKAHSVPRTFVEKQVFFDVNLTGTENLLKGLEEAPQLPDSFVFISTVAVYGLEKGLLIREDAPLLAADPYGESKIQAEKLILEWCLSHSVKCSILRLPLLVGEKPPGNLGKMIKGIKKGYYFNIAGGKAKKSMVLAEDIAKIILVVAAKGGVYNLSDGQHPCFAELSTIIALRLGKTKPLNIPLWFARLIAVTGDVFGSKAPINTNKLQKITSDLTFDDSKARKVLHWNPRSVLNNIKI